MHEHHIGIAAPADVERRLRADLVSTALETAGLDDFAGTEWREGMDRLVDMVRSYAGADPEVLCEAVEQDVVEHLGGRAHDDIALLAVSVGGYPGAGTSP